MFYMKRQPPRQPQQSRPPMGNRNRTIELSTVPVRAHCPSGGRRYNTIWLHVYDPIFVVSHRTCPLYTMQLQGNLSRAAPPMGNRNRTIELSTVPVRAHCPSGGGGIIPFGSTSTTLYLLCPTGHAPYIQCSFKATSAEPPPPMGNRNRTIELSTVPVRAHCPSGGRRYNTIWLHVFDPIFVVSDRTCPLYTMQPSRQPQQSRPPMGNRNRTIELSTVPVRAHCPSGGGGIIPFGSTSSTLYLLCPTGHVGYKKHG